ncbi:hypothetical protein AR689_10905 [Arthrobacter sp. EpRS71]|nr:hypothetical protein AR689_10905 [Arthrobacter sp. EpRS71]
MLRMDFDGLNKSVGVRLGLGSASKNLRKQKPADRSRCSRRHELGRDAVTTSKAPKLASIFSGGLSIMQVSSEFRPGAEVHVSWPIRLLEIVAGKYLAAGQLRVEGKNARGCVDVTANVTLSNDLVDGGGSAIKRAFPDSALNQVSTTWQLQLSARFSA